MQVKRLVLQVGIKMEGRPQHVHQAQGTYDPICNEWLHAPAGTVAQTAGDRSRQSEHDWAVNKTGISCAYMSWCVLASGVLAYIAATRRFSTQQAYGVLAKVEGS